MSFTFSSDTQSVRLDVAPDKKRWFQSLTGRNAASDIASLSHEDRSLAIAIADLRALQSEHGGNLKVGRTSIEMDHGLCSALDAEAASHLGLPPLVDLLLTTDVEGLVGSPSFRLRYDWRRSGRTENVAREGSILKTSRGPRRIPDWILNTIEIADTFNGSEDETRHWEALARFRQALEPGVQVDTNSAYGRANMTEFLEGLQVKLADSFSISPNENGSDFEVLPFAEQTLDSLDPEDAPSESDAELNGDALSTFQKRVRRQGALPAYRLGDRQYLVVDPSSKPALEVMGAKQRASRSEREAFIRNPRAAIHRAYEEELRESGKLEGLSDVAIEETIEKAAGPALVETAEYSDRVIGLTTYEKPQIDLGGSSGTTWLPESFSPSVVDKIKTMSPEQRNELRGKVEEARKAGEITVTIEGETIEVTAETVNHIDAIERSIDQVDPHPERQPEQGEDPATGGNEEQENEAPVRGGPIVVETTENFWEVNWKPSRQKRQTALSNETSTLVKTRLKDHQVEGFNWQCNAWRAGLPGILNADEQGLGKTLQTLAFLRWLKDHMAKDGAQPNGPVLIVAPTSLLRNWEDEVETHLEGEGLGSVIRLYGSYLAAYKKHGGGQDIQTGEERLDFGPLKEALKEGKGHRFWFLTTYTTLTNYQHSLSKIPFSVAVFDEIQELKNPTKLSSYASRSMNADFRIGLTGTPIENAASDLWSIMDQLCPGRLGSLKEFQGRYRTPDADNMRELYGMLFERSGDRPPLALRRLKENVARELPAKVRRLHPRAMPPEQAQEYQRARDKLSEQKKGSAFKMLHHIRSVSIHPWLDASHETQGYVDASARLSAAFDILTDIKAKNERALIFIEHRRMQFRFVELAKQMFDLPHIDIINGETPPDRRQKIVKLFQEHLKTDRGFDLLVLAPKAAGTGLTLTAATHVIHLSRWWNPAVEEQCNDRVHRIGQDKQVTVHLPMSIHPGYQASSFDCLLNSLMTRKRRLAASALWPMGDTTSDANELKDMVSGERHQTHEDPVAASMRAMFRREGLGEPVFESDRSLIVR